MCIAVPAGASHWMFMTRSMPGIMSGSRRGVCRLADASAHLLQPASTTMSTSGLLPRHRDMLASGRWFGSLPSPMQQALHDHARLVGLRAGELLFQRGDANDGLYAVLDGAIR